jgi:hypothetical protein
MTGLLILLAVLIVTVMVLIIRILVYHPTWKRQEEKKNEPAEKPSSPDESAYWKARADYFITSTPLQRFYYDITPLNHGMFIRYKGTSEQQGMILFCIYDQKHLDAVPLALERIMRHNEAVRNGFCILYGSHPSRELSEEAMTFMKKNYIHVDLCLSGCGITNQLSARMNYLFLGTDRKKTMSLKTEPALNHPVSAVYETPLTLPALKKLGQGNDHRFVMQYQLDRKKALSSLQENPVLCAALCSTCTCDQGAITLSGADDDAVEKMLDECRYAAGEEGVHLYVTYEGSSGRSSYDRPWMKKITSIYDRCDLTEVIPCYFSNDEEEILERVSSEHMAFLPEDLRQCSIIDFYVSLLLG